MTISRKDRIIAFMWQHLLLLFSLFLMTLGVALSVRSYLGSSVISSLPYVFESAGVEGMMPSLTIGQYTYIMNFCFVLLQIVILRRRFEAVQLFQLLIGFVFGSLIDLNMVLTAWLETSDMLGKVALQLAGCTVMGIGIAFEVRCGSVTMPGEGLPVAISRVTGIDFPVVKIATDISIVTCAVIACYIFFGSWQWHIVGVGTLFAMVYVGMCVRVISRHLGWFDRMLNYRPGFRRYIYGLARYIFK